MAECENCGHTEKDHTHPEDRSGVGTYWRGSCTVDGCDCDDFVLAVKEDQ